MKKILLIVLAFCSTQVKSQTTQLWGATDLGAQFSDGGIYQVNENGANGQLKHSFDADYRQSTNPNYVLGSNGLLYGITQNGGANNFGSIFTIDTTNDSVSIVFEFSNPTSGYAPTGEIVMHSNGDLYMYATQGGSNNRGAIVSYSTTTNLITKRYDVSNTDGDYSLMGLSKGLDGNFYGQTRSGGTNAKGTLFKFDPITNIYTDLYAFNIASFSPVGPCGVTYLSSGILLGMLEKGGATDDGVIFKYDLTLNTFTIVHEFNSSVDGDRPRGRLMETATGDVVGATTQGGPSGFSGAVFTFDPVGDTMKVVVDVTSAGSNRSQGSLNTLDGTLFYGFALYSAYSYNSVTGVITAIGAFPSNITPPNLGKTPEGVPYILNSQKIIGYTDVSEFSFYAGTVFKLDIPGGVVNTLKQLGSSINGAAPSCGLVQYDKDSLYGSVSEGGENGIGGIYRYSMSTGSSKIVYSFENNDGSRVEHALILGTDSLLYGTTTENGGGNQGTLFSCNPKTGVFTKLYDFNTLTGTHSEGSLREYNNALYGVLSLNGASAYGAIFKYDLVTSTFSIVHDFNNTQGAKPAGTLTLDSTTNSFYGVCSEGGTTNQGVLYSFNLLSNSFAVIKEFTSTGSGVKPFGNVVKIGNLIYGITQGGGANSAGTAFKYDISSTFLTPIHSFNSVLYGTIPSYELLKTSTDEIFGVRRETGSYQGMVYEIDTQGDSVALTYNMVSSVGSGVLDKLIEVIIECQTTYDTIVLSNCDSVKSPSGKWFASTGVYTDTIMNNGGCDSILNINATVYPSYQITLNDTGCTSYTWAVNNQTYTTSGSYTVNLSTFTGCDSTIVLNLIVKNVNTGTSLSGNVISASESGATYQWLYCDSAYSAISGETSQSIAVVANGNYAVEITKDGCVDTSACVNISSIGIEEINNAFNVYPNPTRDIVYFSSVLDKVSILSVNGKVLETVKQVKAVNLSNYNNGVYFIRYKNATVRIMKID